jgi:hypothetical protein
LRLICLVCVCQLQPRKSTATHIFRGLNSRHVQEWIFADTLVIPPMLVTSMWTKDADCKDSSRYLSSVTGVRRMSLDTITVLPCIGQGQVMDTASGQGALYSPITGNSRLQEARLSLCRLRLMHVCWQKDNSDGSQDPNRSRICTGDGTSPSHARERTHDRISLAPCLQTPGKA